MERPCYVAWPICQIWAESAVLASMALPCPIFQDFMQYIFGIFEAYLLINPEQVLFLGPEILLKTASAYREVQCAVQKQSRQHCKFLEYNYKKLMQTLINRILQSLRNWLTRNISQFWIKEAETPPMLNLYTRWYKVS